MMSHSSQNPFYDVIEGSKERVANKCENTSLGIIEMADKQRRHCSADKFKTKQPNSNGKIEEKPKVNKTTYALCMFNLHAVISGIL